MILKLGMDHWKFKVYKVYLNADPRFTLTLARSNLVKLHKKCNQILMTVAQRLISTMMRRRVDACGV